MDKRIKRFLESLEETDVNLEAALKDLNYLKESGFNLDWLEPFVEKQLTKNVKYAHSIKEMGIEAPDKASMLHLLVSYHKATNKYKKITGIEYVNSDKKRLPSFLILEYYKVSGEIIRLEDTEIPYKKAIEAYLHFEKEFTSNEVRYLAVVPKTQKELMMEGYNMHNCLVMRGPYIAHGDMKILFIRKEDNKPFIDVIMDKDDHIIWAITDYHETVTGDLKTAVYDWYRTTVKDVPESKMWAN